MRSIPAATFNERPGRNVLIGLINKAHYMRESNPVQRAMHRTREAKLDSARDE